MADLGPRVVVMTAPLVASHSLRDREYRAMRMRAIFECGKLDPACHDIDTIAPFVLKLAPGTWMELSRLAEGLWREALAAERAVLVRTGLLRRLGFPGRVRRAIALASTERVQAARYARFDFHLTDEGWRISEVNADVPGGLIEASGVARLMLEHHPGCALPGDPIEALADAIAGRAGEGAAVGLVHATAYVDDRQVMVAMGRALKARALAAPLLGPDHVKFVEGRVTAEGGGFKGQCDAILRFFPAEWLVNLPRTAAWRGYFRGTEVAQTNPPSALIPQSKRFSLVWDEIDVEMKLWRATLPETRDPRRVPRVGARSRGEWVLKPALGRVGEGVLIDGVTPEEEHKRATRHARKYPWAWAAQRRFRGLPVTTAEGECHPCLGVFVIDGKACGIYGRVAERPRIDGRARDVAVLIDPGMDEGPQNAVSTTGSRRGVMCEPATVL